MLGMELKAKIGVLYRAEKDAMLWQYARMCAKGSRLRELKNQCFLIPFIIRYREST